MNVKLISKGADVGAAEQHNYKCRQGWKETRRVNSASLAGSAPFLPFSAGDNMSMYYRGPPSPAHQSWLKPPC